MSIVESVQARFTDFKEALRPENRYGILIHKYWDRNEGPNFLIFQHRPWEITDAKKNHISKIPWIVDIFEYGQAYDEFAKYNRGDLLYLLPFGLGFRKVDIDFEEIQIDQETLRDKCKQWILANSTFAEGSRYLHL